ncbi:ABC transporter permease [Microbacterium esteraromaticum]|uniref:ABC transporter permease n=1 Tax=Microbacterium esteraromaticum TaxID=57043 RepID=UPI0015CE4DEE|nr:ABC transporter permease [Microbacterium esteraromaticum]MBN8425656.1 ABC transporter permease [Microbacterium esteraromaticum]
MTLTTSPDSTAVIALAETRPTIWHKLRRNPEFWIGGVLVAAFVVMAVWPAAIAGLFGNGDPAACDLSNSRVGPGAEPGHPLGFSVQGCDLFTTVVYGARNSVIVGTVVTLGTSLIAVVLGVLAGYYGGWFDALLSRLSEVVISVPLLLGAVLVLNSVEVRSVWMVSLVLILFSWPTAMRVMRTSTISVAGRGFVTSAKSLGLPTWKILGTHVVPNTIGPVIVLGTLQVGAVIATEATLTYLGIGLQAPAFSWGLQLSQAEPYFASAPHLLYVPAVALTLCVAGFVLLGESIRQAGFQTTHGAA